jgi:photosystem II stability/assembly factor-like uncharacterized protein
MMMTKFQPSQHNFNAKQYGIWGMTNRLWSVGEKQLGGYYDINTVAWTQQTIAATKSSIIFHAVWGTSDTDVWTVGTEGNISHLVTNPPFQMVPSGVAVALNGVWGQGPSNIWAVGDAGTILNTNYDSPIRTHTDLRMEMSCGFLPSPT